MGVPIHAGHIGAAQDGVVTQGINPLGGAAYGIFFGNDQHTAFVEPPDVAIKRGLRHIRQFRRQLLRRQPAAPEHGLDNLVAHRVQDESGAVATHNIAFLPLPLSLSIMIMVGRQCCIGQKEDFRLRQQGRCLLFRVILRLRRKITRILTVLPPCCGRKAGMGIQRRPALPGAVVCPCPLFSTESWSRSGGAAFFRGR